MEFYEGTPARTRAIEAPHVHAPCPFDWNEWEPDEAAALPASLVTPGACSCDTPEPCNEGGPPWPWVQQIPLIDIHDRDAVSDDGQEVFNLLEHRGIGDVIVMGVHTNACVLGRPYGIRQLVALGKKPVLCRDLTDSFHRDERGHFAGTRAIIAHIERRWCPTIVSSELIGGESFRFAEDR